MVYAVIDTNVLISSLITSDERSPTIAVMNAIRNGRIIPVYSDYLLEEYKEVLSREKFHVEQIISDLLIRLFTDNGIHFEPNDEHVIMPDLDDIPIYLIAMQTRDLDSYLVTGNARHFPDVDYVVTPRKMMKMLDSELPR